MCRDTLKKRKSPSSKVGDVAEDGRGFIVVMIAWDLCVRHVDAGLAVATGDVVQSGRASGNREEKVPEVGVPDVKRIQQKLRGGGAAADARPPQAPPGRTETTGSAGDENENML